MKKANFFFLVGLTCVSSLWAAPTMELVQSVPLETTLGVPGVRQTQEVWLEMIKNAKTTLDIEQFYISDQTGEALSPVLSAILEAGRRGVRVRLVADSKFFNTYPESVKLVGNGDNSEARTIDYSKYGGIQHAKYFVVDGKNSFLGSQNFDWRALSHIHEIGIRMEDATIASDLEKIFEKDWAESKLVSKGQSRLPAPIEMITLSPDGASDTSVVASPAKGNPSEIPATLAAVVDLIDSATQSIRIQVMEYAAKDENTHKAWKGLDTPIRKAAKRGVQVELLVDISDMKKAKGDLQSLASVKNVKIKTVTIPPWSGGTIDYARLIHSKYLLVDGIKAWIGSENWSAGYFLNTRNVGVMTTNTDIVSKLDQVFTTVWNAQYSSGI